MLEQDVFNVVSKRFDAADHIVWYITVRASCIERPPMYINIKTWSVMRFIAPTLFVLCQDMINKLRKRVNVGNPILALQVIRLQYFINVRRGQSKIKCNDFKVSWIKLKWISNLIRTIHIFNGLLPFEWVSHKGECHYAVCTQKFLECFYEQFIIWSFVVSVFHKNCIANLKFCWDDIMQNLVSRFVIFL